MELVGDNGAQLRLSLADQDPDATSQLGHDGAWLKRWPKCGSVVVNISNSVPDQVFLLFASAPPATGITSLTLSNEESEDALSGAALVGILRCVPNLDTLILGAAMASPDSSTERALASCAFGHLRSLQSLELNDYAWIPCLPEAVASQLTHLEVDPYELTRDEPLPTYVPAAITQMAALQSVRFYGGIDAELDTQDLRLLLGAAGPSLKTMQARTWCPTEESIITVNCEFSGGFLTSVVFEEYSFEPISHVQVSTFLVEALTGLRTLGPRLAYLGLDLVMEVGEAAPPDPDPAAELLARCEQVELRNVQVAPGASFASVLGVAQHYGVPLCVSGIVLGNKAASSQSSSAPVPWPLPPPMPLPALVERAVGRMVAAAEPSDRGKVFLLLRGSAVRVLLAVPAALHAWSKQLAREVAASGPGPGQAAGSLRVSGYQPLPMAGAVILECGTGAKGQAAAEAAAEVARQLASAGGDSGGSGGLSEGAGGALPAGVLEAIRTRLSVQGALMEVLQSLWDGKDEGGPGPATGSREGEMARLRWLLEAWEGLQWLPPCRELRYRN